LSLDLLESHRSTGCLAPGPRSPASEEERTDALPTAGAALELLRLPPLAIRMLRIGEQSGELAALSYKVADFYEARLERSLARLVGFIGPAAVILTEVGRGQEILALGGDGLPSRWIQAARCWALGDLTGAADLFQQIGSAGDEAYARTKHAERLIATGHRAEAEPFLSRALELYREMGATAFIREAERLLAPPA
jgi:hypothetical protein